jgi:hypothetical protein
MQPITITYVMELAVGLAAIVAITGTLMIAAADLLIARASCGAKPSRRKGTRSRDARPHS